MNWKELPTWLKGGLIGLGIFLIFFLLIILIFNGRCGDMGCAEVWILVFSTLPTVYLTSYFLNLLSIPMGYNYLFYLVPGIIQYFILGSLAGYIYSKFRKSTKN